MWLKTSAKKCLSFVDIVIQNCSYLVVIIPGTRVQCVCFNVAWTKKVREKSREYHNHKPQPFPDTKKKRKPTNPNKHKSNKHTKSNKISSLFPKRGHRKKGKRKVQGVPQSQTAALPRPQEEEETDKSKQAQPEQTYGSL